MAEPLVCAVMLTRDRPEMAARAVRCFRDQTYANKWLLVWNSGDSDEIECGCNRDCFHAKVSPSRSIGDLRNHTIAFKSPYRPPADIVIHWDDDDISHPNRIAEQIALLQSSGAECVGYSEMLFWGPDLCNPSQIVTCRCGYRYPRSGSPCPKCHVYYDGESWLYTAPSGTAPGASLCYWRSTWERRPFPDVRVGEDAEWLKGVKLFYASCLKWDGGRSEDGGRLVPRLIATIHGGNTSSRVDPASPNWRRVPEWDNYCRDRCAL